MRRAALLLAAAALAVAIAPGQAHARRKKSILQPHEIRLDFDIGVANQANVSFFDARYLWTPSPLESEDLAVPAVRRFVRHPTEIYFNARREGSTLDTRTGAFAGATVHVLDGLLYLRGEGGLEIDDVRYDGTEGGYYAAPYHLELGGRPIPLLSVGAYFRGRPIIDYYRSDAPVTSNRDGGETEYGGVLAFATPDDRLLGSVSFGRHRADWSFTSFSPGEMDVEGYRGTASFTWQANPNFSWIFRAAAGRETWDNRRTGIGALGINPPFARLVWNAQADVGILYWHEQRYGFRFSLGGAYDGEKPILNGEQRGYFRFGFGVVLRF
jgi:hypothetical protein